MTEDDDIVLSVEKTLHDKKVQNDRTFIRREFGYSKFVKRLSLPDNIDKENYCCPIKLLSKFSCC